jgi:putative glutamine amidotransferase
VHAALALYGARVVHLSPARPDPPEPVHGVVVTGGHDIEPVLYAAPREVETHYDTERDAFESVVIEEALERGLPLLGICRGAQLLNVRLGGSLHQELRSRRERTSNRRTVLPLKTLRVEPGTLLCDLLGADRVRINSLHDQGIHRLGRGLRVSGRDLDDIVQAVEAPARGYLLGVQWHPEFLIYSARQRRLFRALVESARAGQTGR